MGRIGVSLFHNKYEENMKTITINRIKKETRYLNALVTKYGRVTKPFQIELTKLGYELRDLGTSKRCFTSSCVIGEKFRANDTTKYFGIGIYNHGTSTNTGIRVQVYRAWVKEIRP